MTMSKPYELLLREMAASGKRISDWRGSSGFFIIDFYKNVFTIMYRRKGRLMRIVWDQNKNRSNQVKHKVSFEVASFVFDDPLHVSRLERVVDSEERWQTVGMVGGGFRQ
jgi:hypothetical protein